MTWLLPAAASFLVGLGFILLHARLLRGRVGRQRSMVRWGFGLGWIVVSLAILITLWDRGAILSLTALGANSGLFAARLLFRSADAELMKDNQYKPAVQREFADLRHPLDFGTY